jgi:hypothetical protein
LEPRIARIARIFVWPDSARPKPAFSKKRFLQASLLNLVLFICRPYGTLGPKSVYSSLGGFTEDSSFVSLRRDKPGFALGYAVASKGKVWFF